MLEPVTLLVSSVGGPVANYGIQVLIHKIKCRRKLKENYTVLMKDLDTLLKLKADNEKRVREQNDKVASNDYLSWRDRASKIHTRVSLLKYDYDNHRHSKGYFQLAALSEEMEKNDNEVKSLIVEGRSISIFLVDKPPERVIKVYPDLKITEYPTLTNALKEILSYLDSSAKVIGVYGKKGVGKTTILKHLNDSDELIFKHFDIVIFIKGLTDHNVIQILQKAIASRLNVKIKATEGSIDEDAQKIRGKLQDKKYLLILDGVVSIINLQEVGISDNDKGSKVVVASQFLHVCYDNKANVLVEVNLLEEPEAWHMFRNGVPFGNAIDSRRIRSTAKLVCKRCSCLPLLIDKIARSLESTTEDEILVELKDLNNLWMESENEGIEELYSFLKGCYRNLRDQQPICFLYTSLYPADTEIYASYLVECWAALGFLGQVNTRGSYQEARSRGRSILKKLVRFSFLEKNKGEEGIKYVTLIGCMREFAVDMLSKDGRCSYVIDKNEGWQSAKWVSLINSPLPLPNENCSMLEILLLRENSKLATIPQPFFGNMSKLVLLDLYGTGITKLPSTLSKLTSVKGLYLNGCKDLEELPPDVQSLQLLEVLDIRGTNVGFISSYIESLVNLRCLRIPYIKRGNPNACPGAEADKSDAIPKLQHLEELTIEVKSCEEWNNRAKNVMEQLSSLEGLITLKCSFPSSEILTFFKTRLEQWKSQDQFTSLQISQEIDLIVTIEFRQ